MSSFRILAGVDIVEEDVLLLAIHVHLESLILRLNDVEGLDPAAVIPIRLPLNDGNTQGWSFCSITFYELFPRLWSFFIPFHSSHLRNVYTFMTDLFPRKSERRVGKGLIPQKVEEGHILVHHHLATTQGAAAGAGLRAKAPEGVRAEAGAHIQKTI